MRSYGIQGIFLLDGKECFHYMEKNVSFRWKRKCHIASTLLGIPYPLFYEREGKVMRYSKHSSR